MPEGSLLNLHPFKLADETGKAATVHGLCKAMTAFATLQGVEPEEYGLDRNPSLSRDARIPDYRWLVAYVVEGGSEGYYVHVDAIKGGEHIPLGLSKTYSFENATELAKQYTRFLVCAAWN